MSGSNGNTGTILHLQRLSTEDGPGIRTTVFFKGCPLHCAWCHNPESIDRQPQVQWVETRCIGCITCLDSCPQNSLLRDDTGLHINRETCTACGECVLACPSGALELLGRTVHVEELFAELEKDRAFFQKSGGGVTLSGGEPTLQPSFALNLLTALQASGIPVALDTCGYCTPEILDELLVHVDTVLFDFKIWDEADHKRWTGAGNTAILSNLKRVAAWVRENPQHHTLWIRTPLIPGATDSPENIKNIGSYLAGNLDGIVDRWELCAFNNLCRDKYTRLGKQWFFKEENLLRKEHLREIESWAKQSGFQPERVFITGAAQQED